MKFLYIILIFVALMSLFSCQKTGLFVANIPANLSEVSAESTVSYGSEAWQKLDIYRPSQHKTSTDLRPVVVFFYGGGWSSGSKGDYRFVADKLTREGFVVIIPDYAKYPSYRYPAYQQDAAKVSRWLADNIESHGGDAKQLHVLGHSAGAHIGAMLLADGRFLEAEGLAPNMYQSFVGLAGPYNFTPRAQKYVNIFGPPERFAEMQVSNFIDGSEPPMLLLHGGIDTTVGKFNLETLSKTILSKQGRVENKVYSAVGHLTIIGAFSRASPIGRQVTADAIAFFKRHSSGK